MQAVRSLVERLSFNRDRIGERNRRILICSRSPHLSVRHEFAPDLAAIGQRTMIVDGDIGDADALRYQGMLALPRQIEHQGFARGSLCMAETRYQQNNRDTTQADDSCTWNSPSRSRCHEQAANDFAL